MTFPEITPTEANAALDRYRIIDVRERHEFFGPLGSLEGAELIPLSTVGDSAEQLAEGRPLLLVCRSGGRSGKACETLQALGIPDVTNLAGGMIAWNRAGLPVVRTDPKTLNDLLEALAAWLAQVTGASPGAARGRIDALLEVSGDAAEGLKPRAVGRLLDSLTRELSEAAQPPPDLDLTMDAYRKALASL